VYLEVTELTTHFAEDVYKVTTKCGIALLKISSDDDCSLDINDCTCPSCLRLVISDLTERLQVIHFVEDVAEMLTICGLTSLKDRPNEETSLDITDCTCLQCLSYIIGDLTTQYQNPVMSVKLKITGFCKWLQSL
jgi:hypothetical protein